MTDKVYVVTVLDSEALETTDMRVFDTLEKAQAHASNMMTSIAEDRWCSEDSEGRRRRLRRSLDKLLKKGDFDAAYQFFNDNQGKYDYCIVNLCVHDVE